MGKRGTRPKPTALKIANGSAKNHPERLNRGEPRPPDSGRTSNPFEPGSHAADAWQEMVDHARTMKVLTDPDYRAIELYARSYQEYRDALAVIADEGKYMGRFRHPADHVRQAAWKECRQMLQEFGMTPASRSQVTVHAGDKDEGFAALASRSG